MVGGDDHERTVEDPLRLQAANEQPERAVGVLGLEQEALVALDRRPVALRDVVVDPAQERRLHPVAPAGRQVQVRHVRQQ